MLSITYILKPRVVHNYLVFINNSQIYLGVMSKTCLILGVLTGNLSKINWGVLYAKEGPNMKFCLSPFWYIRWYMSSFALACTYILPYVYIHTCNGRPRIHVTALFLVHMFQFCPLIHFSAFVFIDTCNDRFDEIETRSNQQSCTFTLCLLYYTQYRNTAINVWIKTHICTKDAYVLKTLTSQY